MEKERVDVLESLKPKAPQRQWRKLIVPVDKYPGYNGMLHRISKWGEPCRPRTGSITKSSLPTNPQAAAEAEAIERIRALPTSQEKRVVSYGLYGSNPKYVVGAVRNSELAKVYFPGWVCRFYCDATVPREIIQQLETNGAEVVFIENIRGAIAGMFWRFLVAVSSARRTVTAYL